MFDILLDLTTNLTTEETTTIQVTTLSSCPGNSTRNDTDNSCYCKPPYYVSPNCDVFCDSNKTCNDHGDCTTEGKCNCDTEYFNNYLLKLYY